MEPFLHSVAHRIWDEHRQDLDRILVVFNNRRAGLFLQKQMLALSDKPFFLPRIVGIDDLIAQLGNIKIAPHEFLLFELFDIHRTLEEADRRYQTFEEFISFGEMMLTDFSEIDLYRVDAEKLFNNISELKRLGEWDLTGAPLTPFQKKYLRFYSSLYTYYNELRQRLSASGSAYTGMAYRNVADNIDSMIDTIDYSHIYFVGFNALSSCEARIIDCCVKRGIGSLICDGDDYYFSDATQEAGDFLRTNAARFDGIGGFKNHFAQENKTLHIINSPENVLQTKAAGQILKELLKDETKVKDTAIVLADEGLLLPMLNSLPEQVHSTNVTMGYPLTLSGVNNLAIRLLSLHCNAKQGRFYHVDVVDILSDTLICKYLGTRDLHNKITEYVNKRKLIYATKDDIQLMLNGIENSDKLMFIFEKSELTPDEMLTLMRRAAELITTSDTLEHNVKETESTTCFLQILNYLEELQGKYHFIEKLVTLQRIYQRIAQRRTVAFYGEPLQGLQILGVLETRSLDFDNLIMLSVNEGTLPAGRSSNSLIPYTLKRAFGIPTFEEKDAVYAYNFYRLLQRTSEAWLLYSSDAEGMGKGEPSRFILQIKNELAVRHPNITVKEEVLTADRQPAKNESTASVHKDENTMQRLKEMAIGNKEKRIFLSPTAINRYRNCPLQFFYNDVLGVHEQQEVSEDLEANELGSLIHEILKDIYKQERIVKKETLEKALKDIDALVDATLHKEFLKGRDDEGRNRLYSEVAKTQISRFLQKEIALLDPPSPDTPAHTIEIKLVEEPIGFDLDMSTQGIDYPVHIEGIADRIDYFDGILRVADYKSGGVNAADLVVKEPEPDPYKVSDKWFQVMTYAWLYCRKEKLQTNFQSGIFPLRDLSSGFIAASWNDGNLLSPNDIDRFEHILQTLFGDMLNPELDFVATPDRNTCAYCPVKRICKAKIIK